MEKQFSLQTIAKGSFIDNGDTAKSFLIEATVIRLNWVALNEWIMSQTCNCRECYTTREEWEAHKSEYEKRSEAVKAKIVAALDIDAESGSVCITQSQSEVFTVVHIQEVK